LSIHEGEEEFSIMEVKSREILEQFLKIFSRLITIYQEYRETAVETINDAVPLEESKEEEKTDEQSNHI
jgi:hypothetical protein